MTRPVPASSRAGVGRHKRPTPSTSWPASEPETLAAYLDLSDRIRTTQVAAARDENAREQLRGLDRERRTRLGALLDHVPEHRDEVERALAVALTDPEVADAARAGRLERIPDTAGGFATFGDALGDAVPAASRRRHRRHARVRSRPAAETRRLARLAELDDEERRADDELASARAALKRAQAALTSAERDVRDAERARERLRAERERLER